MKNIYKDQLENVKTAPTSERYFRTLLNIQQEDMKELYCIPFRATLYTKLRSFQFKINHNILYTSEKLFRVGIKSSPLCTFCKQYTETLSHLFVECRKIETLWNEVKHNLLKPYGIKSLQNKDIILGINTNENVKIL